jgi:hypothetical protein
MRDHRGHLAGVAGISCPAIRAGLGGEFCQDDRSGPPGSPAAGSGAPARREIGCASTPAHPSLPAQRSPARRKYTGRFMERGLCTYESPALEPPLPGGFPGKEAGTWSLPAPGGESHLQLTHSHLLPGRRPLRRGLRRLAAPHTSRQAAGGAPWPGERPRRPPTTGTPTPPAAPGMRRSRIAEEADLGAPCRERRL